MKAWILTECSSFQENDAPLTMVELDKPIPKEGKEIKSVANVTRSDVEQLIRIAAEMPFIPEVEEYALEQANKALLDIKNRRIRGAKVLKI